MLMATVGSYTDTLGTELGDLDNCTQKRSLAEQAGEHEQV